MYTSWTIFIQVSQYNGPQQSNLAGIVMQKKINIIPTMTNTPKNDNEEVEAAGSFHDDGPQKNHTDYKLVDREVAKYATDTAIQIDEATNKRLRRMIDKRILVVMMFTYLIQTLDKGAMSFASIMGIMEDAHLADNQVGS